MKGLSGKYLFDSELKIYHDSFSIDFLKYNCSNGSGKCLEVDINIGKSFKHNQDEAEMQQTKLMTMIALSASCAFHNQSLHILELFRKLIDIKVENLIQRSNKNIQD